jgi:hypothetical protein
MIGLKVQLDDMGELKGFGKSESGNNYKRKGATTCAFSFGG